MKIINTCKANIFLITIVAMIVSIQKVFSQKHNRRPYATIRLIIDHPISQEGSNVMFNMSKDNINTNFAATTDIHKFGITRKSTALIIPLSSTLNYGRIEISVGKPESESALNWGNNLFLFRDKDNVELHINNDKGVYFVGRDAGRYNCIYEIAKHSEISNNHRYNDLIAQNRVLDALKSIKWQYDSLLHVQLKILNKYSNVISKSEKDLLALDCYSRIQQQIVGMSVTPFLLNKSLMFNAAKAFFLDQYGTDTSEKVANNNSLIYSYQFADYVFKREKARAIIQNSLDNLNYYDQLKFRDINVAINANVRAGSLTDKVKLLAFYQLDRRRQSDFSEYIDEAINKASENIFKGALKQFKKSSAVGSAAFAFELTDDMGNTRHLKEFIGKVIVMDFWFTGCSGCRVMAESLKPIVSSFKGNENIVFITISIDAKKEVWLKSIAEEKYSTKDEINLFSGTGRQSSIIDHYNIASYPSLIVIGKDLKIISVSPPDPRIDPENFRAFLKNGF